MLDDLLILKGDEIISLLKGREMEIVDIVRSAYEAHAKDGSVLPQSVFLKFPDRDESSRIIALPAYLKGTAAKAGLKWVASFPSNLERGIDRASAIIVLNSVETGRPEAILEGSIINAKRTAASAALAAKWLHKSGPPERVGLIGCGPINFEIVRFLLATWPQSRKLVIFDSDQDRADQFKRKCEAAANAEVELAADISTVLRECSVVSFATTAGQPHVDDLSECQPGATILHISLRDLSPRAILASENVVDDVEHVCRASTSIHLTEQEVGHRRFIRCSLAELTLGEAPPADDSKRVTVFSPFGLGVLDISVAAYACDLARREGRGSFVNSFLPTPWAKRT